MSCRCSLICWKLSIFRSARLKMTSTPMQHDVKPSEFELSFCSISVVNERRRRELPAAISVFVEARINSIFFGLYMSACTVIEPTRHKRPGYITYVCNVYRTKYIGGHTDVCAGVATASTWEQWEKLMMTKRAFGGILVGWIFGLIFIACIVFIICAVYVTKDMDFIDTRCRQSYLYVI